MKLKQHLFFLILLLATEGISTWCLPVCTVPSPGPELPAQPEVFPIALVYRQQIDERIELPSLTLIGPCCTEATILSGSTLWSGEKTLPLLINSDALYVFMSLLL
jgi:hypothetical protein